MKLYYISYDGKINFHIEYKSLDEAKYAVIERELRFKKYGHKCPVLAIHECEFIETNIYDLRDNMPIRRN